jgi:hypothetical protein
MWNRIKHWWKAEGELVQLQGVSDRMLTDMGLEREGLRDRVLGHERNALPVDGCTHLPSGSLARS